MIKLITKHSKKAVTMTVREFDAWYDKNFSGRNGDQKFEKQYDVVYL